MSLRFRLNLLHGTLLAIALGSIIVAILLDAGPRSRAEYASMMQLARTHVERSLSNLRTAPDADAGLRALLADLGHLRHIRIDWQPVNGGQSLTKSASGEAAHPVSHRVLVDIPGAPRGDIVIAAAPGDEIAEIWETVSTIAFRGVLLAVALFGLSSLLIHHALTPIHSIGNALGSLGAGDFGARVPEAGPPELSAICRALNGLAEALQQAHSKNRHLAREMIGARDRERRELAHELHDELGPCLFSARANGAALVKAAGSGSPDLARIKQLGGAVLEQIERIQNVNRRVLTQLSPPGLKELGLTASLQALADNWQAQRGELRVDIKVGSIGEELAEAEALTVYRIVQEGLTNALRHGDANAVSVVVAEAMAAGGSRPMERGVVVSVTDGGRGLDPAAKPGFGIMGMQERLWALGGAFVLENRPEGGALLEARFPMPQAVVSRTVPPAQTE
jgi:two-component system sensor histidine kinase UhpB